MKNAEGKYPAIYAQGYVNSWSLPANVEELVEIETEASINGKPQDGFATVEADILQKHNMRSKIPFQIKHHNLANNQKC